MASDGDRLYKLLPAFYRERDLISGEPLRVLLGVIEEQVDIVQQDIEQLYDNWFIETCDDWVVPYIGDLIGYRVLDDGNDPEAAGAPGAAQRESILVPRRDVANTIRYRRRKGTVGLLDDLALSIGGWPCRVVEFDRLLAGTQSIRHLRLAQGRTAEVRSALAMGRVGSAFDSTAHGHDVRRPQSLHTRGRYNLPGIGVFIWRLLSLPVTRMQANRIDRSERAAYTFSVLGNDCPLFIKPAPASAAAESAREFELPMPLTRAVLADAKGCVAERYYGVDRSLALWRREGTESHLIPRDMLVVADLSGWRAQPRRGTVAIDPELGRIGFALGEAPDGGLLVSYHRGFSAMMGGGEYPRKIAQRTAGSVDYSVGPQGDFGTLDEALLQWQKDRPTRAVIELSANDVYPDPKPIVLRENQRLEIRAGSSAQPLIDLRERNRDAREFFNIRGAPGSRLLLVGLLVAGRALQLKGHLAELAVRHCTFVPGWEANAAATESDATPSMRLDNVQTRIVIEHSILGPISVMNTVPELEPLELVISDSIVDAGSSERRALDAPERQPARVRLTVQRSTLIGRVNVSDLEQAEDSLFLGVLDVTRRQAGCVRHCYVDPASRTPRRYACQPDLALAGADAAEKSAVSARVRPIFNSLRFGTPAYAQLADTCAVEITHGAQDESEMGAFHDLYQPQRLGNLKARLDEYVPAGADVGIVKAS